MQRFFKKIFIVAIFFLTPSFAFAANLYINPSSGSLEVGQKITLQLMVSADQSINAISSLISVPTSIFTIESVSKNSSILNFWVTEPSFSSANGTINLEGVTLGGYSAGNGNIVTITLKAKSVGTDSIVIKNGQILANDGQGTNVTGSLNGGTFTIKPAAIKPAPKQEIKKPAPVVEEPKEEVVAEEPQKKPSLLPPKILSYVSDGKRFISGSSSAVKSNVLITFESRDWEKLFITGETDDKGNFTLPVPNSLKRGVYKVHAVVIQEDITHSFKSNELRVRVGNIISDISIEIWIGLGAITLFLIGLIIKLLISIKKVKNLRSFIKKEASEAEDILGKSFALLEEDLNQAIKTENSRKRAYKNIKGDLNEAKKAIRKEIKDIK